MKGGDDFVAMIESIVVKTLTKMYPEGLRALDGVMVPGSWNAKNGTIDVALISSAAYIEDPSQQLTIISGVQLATTGHGHQTPPDGAGWVGPSGDGERVILIPRESGFLAILEHGHDDSPGAPAGESWQLHKTGSYTKMVNSGDVQRHANANITDTASNITHTATSAASMHAPTITLAPVSGTTYAVVHIQSLQALYAWLLTHTHSGVSSGGSNTGAPSSAAPAITPSSSVLVGS